MHRQPIQATPYPPPPPGDSFVHYSSTSTPCDAQGEALAFVLGGAKRMLRAKSLASLINQDAVREDRDASAQVGHGRLLRARVLRTHAARIARCMNTCMRVHAMRSCDHTTHHA